MDSDFSRMVDDAASIASSGRWDAVNERIEHLAAKPGVDNGWWLQLFASLCAQAFSEYLLLKRAYADKRGSVPLLAWRARNLLELSAWCLYCSKNKENARRFYEDAGRDVLGILNAFTKWGRATAQAADWLDLFDEPKQDISRRAASDGIQSLDGAYKLVNDAAKDAGIGDHFTLSYRMLSKFAHPTSMQILAAPDESRDNWHKDLFYSQGCLFFVGAFTALEDCLRRACQ